MTYSSITRMVLAHFPTCRKLARNLVFLFV